MVKRAPGATLPVVRVVGTHAELGRAMGLHKAQQIRTAVDAALEHMRELEITEAALREQIAPYVAAAEATFPQYVVELREMARAAEVPFDLVFRLNCYESWPAGLRRRRMGAEPAPAAEPPSVPAKDPGTMAAGAAANVDGHQNGCSVSSGEIQTAPAAPPAADGCTSVVSQGERGIVAGHTEDSFPEAADGLYLFDATIAERNPFTGAERSRFLALNYAQTLPGCAAAVNDRGLIVLIDALPDPERNVGVPRHFVSRALLDTEDIESAIDLLRTTNRGGGWNFVLVQGQRAVNVETTATRVSATEVTDGRYAHTNHYVDQALSGDPGEPRPNSLARLTRALELVRPGLDVAAMKHLLSDRQGFPDSICRERTIGAFIADTAARRVAVCWGEPERGTWTEHEW